LLRAFRKAFNIVKSVCTKGMAVCQRAGNNTNTIHPGRAVLFYIFHINLENGTVLFYITD